MTPIASKLAVFARTGKGNEADENMVHREGVAAAARPRRARVLIEFRFCASDRGMRSKMARRASRAFLCGLLLALAAAAGAQQSGKPREFRDEEFGYGFLFPAEWKIEPFPEGKLSAGLRVRLAGPRGSSIVAIVERSPEPLSKVAFQSEREPEKRVQAMIAEALDRFYRPVGKNLGALAMKVGEKRNLTDDDAIRFYIATLHPMKTGRPVVVAGTHAYPFSKDYSIKFVLTAFNEGDTAESRILTAVFNSFRLLRPENTAPGK